jgi:hypothetical protein
MTFRRFAAAVLAVGVTPAAFAQEPDLQCFARAYSAEHLVRHPGQRVTEVMVAVGRSSEGVGGFTEAVVRAMMRDRFGEFFANAAICVDEGGRWSCGIECDGGTFDLELAADGTLMLRNEEYGFVLHGGCGSDVAEDRAIWLDADAEHRAFRLYPLPPEACPRDFWLAYDRPDTVD